MYFSITILASVIIMTHCTPTRPSIFFRTRSMQTSWPDPTEQPSTMMAHQHFLQFFDPITNETLIEPMVGPLITRSVDPASGHRVAVDQKPRATTTVRPSGWFSNLRRPCSCSGVKCGCCAGVDFKRLSFRRQCKLFFFLLYI